jgi:rhamnogalacturonyl hydrolase YesR
MMTWYAGNETGQIPGKLVDTWWEGGAMFMALIQYWHFTGDTTYNDEVTVGMEFQAGDGDYMPSNYSNYIVSLDILGLLAFLGIPRFFGGGSRRSLILLVIG